MGKFNLCKLLLSDRRISRIRTTKIHLESSHDVNKTQTINGSVNELANTNLHKTQEVMYHSDVNIRVYIIVVLVPIFVSVA